jgi:hypothetical protein
MTIVSSTDCVVTIGVNPPEEGKEARSKKEGEEGKSPGRRVRRRKKEERGGDRGRGEREERKGKKKEEGREKGGNFSPEASPPRSWVS